MAQPEQTHHTAAAPAKTIMTRCRLIGSPPQTLRPRTRIAAPFGSRHRTGNCEISAPAAWRTVVVTPLPASRHLRT